MNWTSSNVNKSRFLGGMIVPPNILSNILLSLNSHCLISQLFILWLSIEFIWPSHYRGGDWYCDTSANANTGECN